MQFKFNLILSDHIDSFIYFLFIHSVVNISLLFVYEKYACKFA